MASWNDQTTPLVLNDPVSDGHYPVKEEKKASKFLSTFNLCISAIGGGVLAFPYAYSETGLVSGILSTLIILPIIAYSEYIIIVACERSQAHNFSQIVTHYVGDRAARFADLVVVLLLLGAVMSYISLIGDIGSHLISQATSNSVVTSSQFLMVLAAAVIIWPCFNRRLTEMGILSVLGVLPVIYLGIVVIIKGFIAIGNGDVSFDNAIWTINFVDAFPLFVFAYQAHVQAPVIYVEQEEKTIKNMRGVIGGSILMESFLYISIGALGYVQFGSDTDSNITDNYSDDDIPIAIARGMLVVHFLMAIPFAFVIARTSFTLLAVQPILMKNYPEEEEYEKKERVAHIVTTVVLFLLCLLLAILAPGASFFFSIVGSTCGVTLVFIFPAFFAYHLAEIPDWIRWGFIGCCFILTLFVGIGGTIMTIRDSFF